MGFDVPVGEHPSNPSNPSNPSSPSSRRPRRRRSALSRWLGKYGETSVIVLLCLTVAASAQAMGAVHAPVLLAVASTGLLACALCYRARMVGPWLIPRPSLIMLALAAFTLLQALPLPLGLLTAIAPANAEVWATALAPFPEAAPRWASLSLDPGASVIEALKWFLYAAVFAVAAAVGARRGAHWGALIVFVSGALLALSSFGHRLTGATSVYGIYTPVGEFAREKIGPLLNPNNLSGYLNIGVFSGFGLLVMRRPPVLRGLIGLGVAMQIGAVVEAGSRGGLGALVLGIVAFGLVLAFARKEADATLADSVTVRRVIGLVVVGGVLLAVAALVQQRTGVVGNTNFEKLKVLVWTKQMILDHPWFGIGRGAFESVFPKYRVGPSNMIYAHPENFLVQWVSEWGLPISVAALGALAVTLRPKAIGVGAASVATGLYVALLALLAQNLVDLGLEVPAIPIAIAVALGSAWGATQRGDRTESKRSEGQWPVRLAWASLIVSAALLWVSSRVGFHTVGDDRLRLRAALAQTDLRGAEGRGQIRSELRAAMLRHPAEPYFSRVGAVVAWRGGQNPLPWIDRALERCLTSGRTHYLLGRILASWDKRSQAILELRFAAEYDPDLVPRAAEHAVSIARTPEELIQVVPHSSARARVLEAVAALLRQPARTLFRDEFLKLAVTRFPAMGAAHLARAMHLLDALESGSAICLAEQRPPCLEDTEREVVAVGRHMAGSFAALEVKARWLMVTGDAARAVELLTAECSGLKSPKRCHRLRLSAAALVKSGGHVDAAARAVLDAGCETPAACAESHESLGDTMARLGNLNQALLHYQRAAREEPSNHRWQRVADTASRLEAHIEAVDALEHMSHDGVVDPKVRARIQEERRRALLKSLKTPR